MKKLTLALLFVITLAFAASAQEYLQFYSEEQIPTGTIVSVVENDSSLVVPAEKSSGAIVGVTVLPNDVALKITDERTNNVFTAQTGVVDLLVTDANGDIKEGDRLELSGIHGVAWLGKGSGQKVGVAKESLSTDKVIGQQTVVIEGLEKTVNVGIVQASISLGSASVGGSSNGLVSIVQELSGRTLSSGRVIAAAAVFVVTLVVIGVMIFTITRSTISAVARNPLSKTSVSSTSIKMVFMLLGMVISSGFIIYILIFR